MTENIAREIAAWRYGGECAVYDLPPWERMKAGGFALANPQKWHEYRVFLGENGEILAFSRQILTDSGIKLGLGVRPDCLSRGIGSGCVNILLAELKKLHPGARMFLEVRDWNKRAIRCYEKCGFIVDQIFEQTTPAGTGTFCRMTFHDAEK